MEAIVCPQGRKTKEEWVLRHMTSLLGSLYLYVWTTVSMSDGVDEARYAAARKDVVDALEQARQTITIKDVDEEEAWEGWRDIQASDIDDAAVTINRYGWLESDWAKGIQDLIQREEDTAAETTHAGKRKRSRAGPIRRTDTMMQEKYDYLSEKRRKEYDVWKRSIMIEITRLERQKE
jgi:origin recognition complex subunit 6